MVLPGKSHTFASSIRHSIPCGDEVSRPAFVVMKAFFTDKQSAPWWLMLLLQIAEAVIQAFTNQ